MKLTPKTKKILKIASLSALALLEIYLIYACAASMYTYHQHPRFESASGQIAQSSGYRSQFFVCIAFAAVSCGVRSIHVLVQKTQSGKARRGAARSGGGCIGRCADGRG